MDVKQPIFENLNNFVKYTNIQIKAYYKLYIFVYYKNYVLLYIRYII